MSLSWVRVSYNNAEDLLWNNGEFPFFLVIYHPPWSKIRWASPSSGIRDNATPGSSASWIWCNQLAGMKSTPNFTFKLFQLFWWYKRDVFKIPKKWTCIFLGGCLGCENTFSEGIWSRTCCNTRIILQCAPNSLNFLKVKYHLEKILLSLCFF